jgi:hypothetical protein
MGIPLERGQDFTIHDRENSPLVVIINEHGTAILAELSERS